MIEKVSKLFQLVFSTNINKANGHFTEIKYINILYKIKNKFDMNSTTKHRI